MNADWLLCFFVRGLELSGFVARRMLRIMLLTIPCDQLEELVVKRAESLGWLQWFDTRPRSFIIKGKMFFSPATPAIYRRPWSGRAHLWIVEDHSCFLIHFPCESLYIDSNGNYIELLAGSEERYYQISPEDFYSCLFASLESELLKIK